MRKMWRVVFSIVLIMILIGIVTVAVGFLTGADTSRLMQTLNNSELVNSVQRYFESIYRASVSAAGTVIDYVTALFGA